MKMFSYVVQYRINGGRLQRVAEVRARSAAGAIAQIAPSLADIRGTLDIIATPQNSDPTPTGAN